jgi:hypothetical protein
MATCLGMPGSLFFGESTTLGRVDAMLHAPYGDVLRIGSAYTCFRISQVF